MKIQINSAEDMVLVGQKLGMAAKGGDVIELIGDVGAGKTTLTKGIAEGMKISGTVHSPTFTIHNEYLAPDGRRLMHYDFYRLDHPGIMSDELDEAINDPDSVVVIEWGDIVADILPINRLTISLRSVSEDQRELNLVSVGKNAEKIVAELA